MNLKEETRKRRGFPLAEIDKKRGTGFRRKRRRGLGSIELKNMGEMDLWERKEGEGKERI